ncbi:myosin-binding protein 7-like [Phragmites australis]|uniref:myosin-binding protein 7-like n=1 Tax=Phragmites australis TaxID=29695 RepID=UPI002D7781C2|nr:myosin-binding protein 7-like [Phragmites australis]
MDEERDQDSDPPPAAAGAGGWCPCCSSSPSSAEAAAWRRSVKRKLGEERGEQGDGEEEGAARVDAEEEEAALREAVAAAQGTAALLRVEVDEERLAAASAASEAMAMMLRLQREKAEVQMELRQFRRFADEKMALDAAEIEHLRALLAQRARCLVRLRARLREYRLQCLHLGIPLPEGEDVVAQNGEEEEDLLLLEDEEGYGDGDGGYYPKLRCYDGEYYYEDRQEQDNAVVGDLERRICLLEHGQETHLLELSLEEEEGAHLYTDEVLPESSRPGRGGLYANEMLPEEAVEDRSNLYNDDEDLPESPSAGCGGGEEGVSQTDGVGSASGSDRVYTIVKVHQGASVLIAKVPEKHQDDAVEPDIKKLYMRLEALEADRESMRQALVAMRTEKAQFVLLREIAQQLAKDSAPVGARAGVVPGVNHSPGKNMVGVVEMRFTEDKKAALKTFSMVALFKWVLTLFVKKKKPSQSRYTFGLSSNNVGLLLLLDKCPRI